MPRAVALDRRIEELLHLGEGDDLVELALDLRRGHAKDGAVEIDVLPAGQFRVEAGADLQQAARRGRGCGSRRSVGSVMRLRILSSVLLPAPLRPMMPTTSPRLHLEGDVLQRPELLTRPRTSKARQLWTCGGGGTIAQPPRAAYGH